MSESKVMSPLDAIIAKREARRVLATEARAAQDLIDLTAIDALEEEFGFNSVTSCEVRGYTPGLPARAAVKAPEAKYYKRYCDQVRRANDDLGARGKALDMLAEACWVYPSEPEVRKSMLEKFPGLLLVLGLEAIKLAELKASAEEKH